jgi:RNA polymerase sigma-70 factor (ECF subfamily)
MKDMSNPAQDDVARIGRDPDAFSSFYLAHLERVQRFVSRRVSDPQLAADLTAEVFLAAVESADSYRAERGAPEAWLIGVARNVINNEFRRMTRDREITRRISGRRLLDADSIAEIEERIDAERAARAMYHAVASLRPKDRALMELVSVDGLSVNDAAAVLGLKPGTARVRLHRSRARVQSLLLPSAALITEVQP